MIISSRNIQNAAVVDFLELFYDVLEPGEQAIG